MSSINSSQPKQFIVSHVASNYSKTKGTPEQKRKLLEGVIKDYNYSLTQIINLLRKDELSEHVSHLFFSQRPSTLVPKSVQKVIAMRFIEEFGRLAFNQSRKFDLNLLKKYLTNVHGAPEVAEALDSSFYKDTFGSISAKVITDKKELEVKLDQNEQSPYYYKKDLHTYINNSEIIFLKSTLPEHILATYPGIFGMRQNNSDAQSADPVFELLMNGHKQNILKFNRRHMDEFLALIVARHTKNKEAFYQNPEILSFFNDYLITAYSENKGCFNKSETKKTINLTQDAVAELDDNNDNENKITQASLIQDGLFNKLKNIVINCNCAVNQ